MAGESLSDRFRTRIRSWALRRQGTDAPPCTLASRRVYILPTRTGWTFSVLIVVMFVAGMNYGNGLALLLTFWLTGFALVAMIQTQRTLAGASLLSATARPAYAGDKVELRLGMSSRASIDDILAYASNGTAHPVTVADHQAATDHTLHLAIPAQRRGIWQAPVLRLESHAPFGLFRTWTWLQLGTQTIVYPQPLGDLPVPEVAGDHQGSWHSNHQPDELAWLRDFREGDSPRQVAWKAYARGAPLLVREYRGNAAAVREFDYTALGALDMEARLSQLCRWVVDAAARNEYWTLRMPDAGPLSGSGADHLAQCLERLALFGIHRDSAP